MADAEDKANASDEERDPEVVAGQASKKKKRRPKKKGAGAAAQDEGVEEEDAADKADDGHDFNPPAREAEAASAPQEAPAAADDESGDEAGEEAQDATSAKKKKKKKKKAGAGAAANTNGTVSRVPGASPPDRYGGTDEEFKQWCLETLEKTKNGTEKMSEAELKKPAQVFFGFKFVGDLRPAYVTPQLRMPEGIMLTDYALDPNGASISERNGPKEVPILEGKDLETMREACRRGREVLDIASRFMRAGVTGDQIDRVVYQACVDRKIYPSPLNYYRFPKAVCVSPNEVICHGIPDCRPIEEGDIVNLDVSIYHEGYHADLNETFFIGQCDDDAHRVVKTAYSALFAAADMIKPGTFYRDLGNAIHMETAKNNCAVVTTYCGHGVGQLFHGPPKVPHYRKNKAVGIMKPGHVFTVEPMINLGSNGGDRTWPDNWTAVTRDGKRSAQFEHTFLVTQTGVEVLTARQYSKTDCMPPYDPAMFQL